METPTIIPTKISVGRWMATATLDTDMTPHANQKNIDNLRNVLSLCFIHHNIVAIAIVALTAAWSLGKGSFGKCPKMSWCLLFKASSGLDLSPKNWMSIFTELVATVEKKKYNAASL